MDTKPNHKFLHSTTVSLIPRRLLVGEGLEDTQILKTNSYLLIIILYYF